MSNKEKVLKVHPDAESQFSGFNWGVRSYKAMEVLGVGNSEESAWQNAAESLPAQPEQKVVYDAWGKAGRLQPVAPVEAKEKEQRAANIPCYEVYDAKDIDCTVFQHERMNDLQDFVYQLLDGLEDGESIRIEFKNYTKEELDEVYDEL